MWLMTTRGFYSVVKRDDQMCVRARSAGDLRRLKELWPALGPILEKQGRDYPFRAFMSPAAFAEGLAKLAAEVNYPDFKQAVSRVNPDRAHTYAKVWEDLLDVEAEREGA
jgi:hypothetical protein